MARLSSTTPRRNGRPLEPEIERRNHEQGDEAQGRSEHDEPLQGAALGGGSALHARGETTARSTAGRTGDQRRVGGAALGPSQ